MTAFKSLSVAILRGFLRDKASVFFALIFPLMFLVLFGGLLGDQSQSKVDLVQVGDVALFDELPGPAKEAFDDTFEVEKVDDLDAALALVRDGDADVAVEEDGGKIAAALFVRRRTVEATLARAYRKLGVDSRAALGAVMAGRGQ